MKTLIKKPYVRAFWYRRFSVYGEGETIIEFYDDKLSTGILDTTKITDSAYQVVYDLEQMIKL